MANLRLIQTNFGNLPPEEREKRLDLIANLGERSERESPLVFKGRDSIRKTIRNAVARVRELPSAEGQIKIITDAPGAGKTSLLRTLKDDLGGDIVTPVMIPSDSLRNPLGILQALITELGGSINDITESATRRVYGKVGTSGTGVSQERETQQSSVWELVKETDVLWHVLNEHLDLPRDHVVVLLVDELQQQRGEQTNFFKVALRQLDAGNTGGIKVLPVFAGLGDTVDTLYESGLSRLAGDPIRLGSLSQSEAESVVADTFEDPSAGLNGLFAEDCLQTVATELALASEGWPRHLHIYITEFAKETVTRVGDDHRQSIDLNVVLDKGHENRCRYYSTRLGRVRQELRDCLMDWCSEHADARLLSVDSLVCEGLDQKAIQKEVDVAVHAGVLQHTDPGGIGKQYEFPIPSMLTYLRNRGDEDKTVLAYKAAHNEQMLAYREASERNADRTED